MFTSRPELGAWLDRRRARRRGPATTRWVFEIGALTKWLLYPYLIFSYRLGMRSFFIVAAPVNYALARLRRNVKYENSVLHVSYMVHVPFYTTRILRRYTGMKADYLAVGGGSPWWNKCDYHFTPSWPPMPWQELAFFWKVVAKYEIIHSHFAMSFSVTGWELPVLKWMGRTIVVHYRGCEVRDRETNIALHPEVNICQVCDYNGSVCREGKARVTLARRYGDLFLVTTPDMKDFVPDAIHFPFFAPETDAANGNDARPEPRPDRPFKIVHVTNHPGIEGTAHLQRAIENLRREGLAIDFVFLKGVAPEQVIDAYRDADLTVGKLKMGFYANAQIESLACGVPALTFVRPELMTPELRSSGFIFTDLDGLESTLRFYLTHPEELAKKKHLARSSILRLHNNEELARRLADLYASARSASGARTR
jgi:glycosyltransferase involved in cell wall biosynthesis